MINENSGNLSDIIREEAVSAEVLENGRKNAIRLIHSVISPVTEKHITIKIKG
jgi:hypothetical protein